MKPLEVDLELIEERVSKGNGKYREQVMVAVAKPDNVPFLRWVTRSLIPDKNTLNRPEGIIERGREC